MTISITRVISQLIPKRPFGKRLRAATGSVESVVRTFAGADVPNISALWESRPDVGLKRAGGVPPRLEERPSTRQYDRRRSNVRPLSPGASAHDHRRDGSYEVAAPATHASRWRTGQVRSALITTVGEQALRPEDRQDRSTSGE